MINQAFNNGEFQDVFIGLILRLEQGMTSDHPGYNLKKKKTVG